MAWRAEGPKFYGGSKNSNPWNQDLLWKLYVVNEASTYNVDNNEVPQHMASVDQAHARAILTLKAHTTPTLEEKIQLRLRRRKNAEKAALADEAERRRQVAPTATVEDGDMSARTRDQLNALQQELQEETFQRKQWEQRLSAERKAAAAARGGRGPASRSSSSQRPGTRGSSRGSHTSRSSMSRRGRSRSGVVARGLSSRGVAFALSGGGLPSPSSASATAPQSQRRRQLQTRQGQPQGQGRQEQHGRGGGGGSRAVSRRGSSSHRGQSGRRGPSTPPPPQQQQLEEATLAAAGAAGAFRGVAAAGELGLGRTRVVPACSEYQRSMMAAQDGGHRHRARTLRPLSQQQQRMRRARSEQAVGAKAQQQQQQQQQGGGGSRPLASSSGSGGSLANIGGSRGEGSGSSGGGPRLSRGRGRRPATSSAQTGTPTPARVPPPFIPKRRLIGGYFVPVTGCDSMFERL